MEINLFGRSFFLSKAIVAVLILAAAIILGVTGYVINSKKTVIIESGDGISPNQANISRISGIEGNKKVESGNVKDENVPEEISIYIVGCVKKPGMVTIKKGQMIFDAIEAAGGTTEEADVLNINMAYKLQDNVMVRIMSKKESLQATATQKEVKVIQSPKQSEKDRSSPAGKGIELTSNSKGAVAGERVAGETGGRVNINTASDKELDSLPGIGIETAKDIIAYRDKNGGFKKPEDIMKITGIKTSKFNKIKDLITVN